jgi:hypothetical protein
LHRLHVNDAAGWSIAYTLVALKKYANFLAPRVCPPLTIVYGGRKRNGRYVLYTLSSGNAFARHLREGIVNEGTGRKFVTKQKIDCEVDSLTLAKAKRVYVGYKAVVRKGGWVMQKRKTSDREEVSLADVALVLSGLADLAIQKGGIPTVGGRVVSLILGSQGLYADGVVKVRDGENNWRLATPDGPLCLPNTTSGNIDDEARQGLAARQAGRTAGPADSPVDTENSIRGGMRDKIR